MADGDNDLSAVARITDSTPLWGSARVYSVLPLDARGCHARGAVGGASQQRFEIPFTVLAFSSLLSNSVTRTEPVMVYRSF
jgi:hypothetical protein